MSELIHEHTDVERALQVELNRISNILGLQQMKVIWTPDTSNTLCGEVNGNTIFIFDRNLNDAITTLRHEVIDYLVCRTVEPYKQTLNALIKLLNDQTYCKKEEIVEKICNLFKTENNKG